MKPSKIKLGDENLKHKYEGLVLQQKNSNLCWIPPSYAAYRRGKYFAIPWQGHFLLLHRVAYVFTNQHDPGELDVDHICEEPRCFNPKHLQAVSNRVNNDLHVARKALKAGLCWKAAFLATYSTDVAHAIPIPFSVNAINPWSVFVTIDLKDETRLSHLQHLRDAWHVENCRIVPNDSTVQVSFNCKQAYGFLFDLTRAHGSLGLQRNLHAARGWVNRNLPD